MLRNVRGPAAGIVWGLLALCIIVAVGVVGFSIIEGWSLLNAFYMTVISISTVGYGEVFPLSPNGRLFATVVIVTGLGSVFFITTMLGRVIIEGEIRGTLKRRAMKKTIDGLAHHTILCGFGRTGGIVAAAMHEDKHPLVVVESDHEAEDHLLEARIPHIIGDATEESVLRSAGVERAATVLCLLPSDANNLYITMMAKDLNPKVKVVARALDEMAERRLRRGGADNVVEAYRIAGHRVLQAVLRPTVNEFIDLVSDRQQLSLILEELTIEEDSKLNGKTIEAAGVRSSYGVIIVAIKKPAGDMIFNPDAKMALAPGDIVIAIGEEAGLRKFGTDCQMTP